MQIFHGNRYRKRKFHGTMKEGSIQQVFITFITKGDKNVVYSHPGHINNIVEHSFPKFRYRVVRQISTIIKQL